MCILEIKKSILKFKKREREKYNKYYKYKYREFFFYFGGKKVKSGYFELFKRIIEFIY